MASAPSPRPPAGQAAAAPRDDGGWRSLRTAAGACAVVLRDAARPLAAISLRFAAGSGQDPAGLSGLAHIIEHMMFCGTRRFGRGDHIAAIEAAGGFVNARTSADWTKYFHVVPSDLITLFFDLEMERLADAPAVMSDTALGLEREVVLSEHHQRTQSTPYGTAVETLLASLYPAHSPYHRLPVGSVEDINRITLADCLRFHDANYVAPGANLAIVGDVRPDEVAERVAALLGILGSGRSAAAGQDQLTAPPDTRRIEVGCSYRPKVFIGCLLPPATSWDFELARFAGLYLGRGVSARLPDRLVRRDQVAAAVTVRTMARAADASVGIIEIAPADRIPPAEVIARLDDVLAESAEVGPADPDLRRTKAVYRASWLADDDTFIGRSDSLTLAMQLTGSAGSYFEHDARISEVGLDDLRQAVRAWHQPRRRVELIYRA